MALVELIEGAKPFGHRLVNRQTLIGRHPACGLTFSSKTVSGIHAKIVKQNRSYYAEDLGSRNGTWVNDQPIREPVKLKHNDCISLGEIVLRFKDDTGFNIEYTDGKQDATKITAVVPSIGQIDRSSETQPEAKLKAVLKITSSLAGPACCVTAVMCCSSPPD